MSVTPKDIEAAIASESYFTAADGLRGSPGGSGYLLAEYVTHDGSPLSLLTFCVLVTTNGHTVTGESHCQDPAKFNAQVGRDEARKAAIKNLWPMVVYAAREKAAVSVAQSLGHQAAEALNAINATPRLIDGAGDPPMHVPV